MQPGAVREKDGTQRWRWLLNMVSPGVLQVRGSGPILKYREIREISGRLLKERVHETLSEIVFDFVDVHELEAPWTPVVAQLIDFARRSKAACKITALHGQPAAIVGLLLGRGGCRKLLEVEDITPACG